MTQEEVCPLQQMDRHEKLYFVVRVPLLDATSELGAFQSELLSFL
jgi:hypothetical protein